MPVLYEHAVRRCEGEVVAGGSFSVNTGAFTGRTPRDKYIVEESGTKDTVWWGNINQPVSPARFDSLHQRMLAYFQRRELFVQDLYAGADPAYRLPVRVVTDSAWHSLFSRNMFIRPSGRGIAGVRARLHDPARARFSRSRRNRRDQLGRLHLCQFRRRGLVLIGGTAMPARSRNRFSAT